MKTFGDPFHEGERFVQAKADALDVADQTSGMIAARVAGWSQRFLAEQRLVVAATNGWASPLFGEPGFASVTEDGRTTRIDLARATRSPADRAWRDVQAGADVGLLAIDLATRRRLRINGTVTAMSAGELVLEVRESYPNCPKYISRRQVSVPGSSAVVAANAGETVKSGHALDTDCEVLIGRADTLFVASHHPERGADASHRGGPPGFVQVVGARDLRIPDYPGNNMFNTLGNLVVHPEAGLTFLDFARRRVLQMTGVARIDFDQDDEDEETGGTHRFWTFTMDEWTSFDTPAGWTWERLA